MAKLTPPALVAGTPRLPLDFGLFSAAVLREGTTDHWEGGGVTWEYVPVTPLDLLGYVNEHGFASSGLPKDLAPQTEGKNPDAALAVQFSVYGHFQVTPIAWDYTEANDHAADNLRIMEESQVENIFWLGTGTSEPNLQDAGLIAIATVADADLTKALGAAEDFIGQTYHSQGVIHLARSYALRLLTNGSIVARGNRLFTALGTPVVAGAGYPVGKIKVSPSIFGYRSEIFASTNRPYDLLDKGSNDLYAVAERSYLLAFDPIGVGIVTIS